MLPAHLISCIVLPKGEEPTTQERERERGGGMHMHLHSKKCDTTQTVVLTLLPYSAHTPYYIRTYICTYSTRPLLHIQLLYISAWRYPLYTSTATAYCDLIFKSDALSSTTAMADSSDCICRCKPSVSLFLQHTRAGQEEEKDHEEGDDIQPYHTQKTLQKSALYRYCQ